MAKIAEKVPSWVERLLIPTPEIRVRGVVKEEVAHAQSELNARLDSNEKSFNARLDGLDTKVASLRNELTSRLDALEERYNLTKDVDQLRAEVEELKERISRAT